MIQSIDIGPDSTTSWDPLMSEIQREGIVLNTSNSAVLESGRTLLPHNHREIAQCVKSIE